ncbi:MAG: hypothetical protein IPJ12_00910 [Betaproteobacteria bacterium]|nr:hypothetical protein [Betaproteobacteria bacterium]
MSDLKESFRQQRAGMILVVSTSKGGGSTLLANRTPEYLAKKLLQKLVSEGKPKSECN